MKTISLPELLSRLHAGPTPALVEALPARYFAMGHLPGAVNINVDEVKHKAGTLLPHKDNPVVVYCASQTCANSDQVAVQLLTLGYTDVRVFKGGKAAWQEAGLGLEAAAA